MKLLITGAAGFIGSHLAETLLAQGHQVIGIDNFLDYYPRWMKEKNLEGVRTIPGFEFIEADLLETDLVGLVRPLEGVIHLAAQAGVRASWGENFRTYSDNNVLATQRLLEACRGEGIKKIHLCLLVLALRGYGRFTDAGRVHPAAGLPLRGIQGGGGIFDLSLL